MQAGKLLSKRFLRIVIAVVPPRLCPPCGSGVDTALESTCSTLRELPRRGGRALPTAMGPPGLTGQPPPPSSPVGAAPRARAPAALRGGAAEPCDATRGRGAGPEAPSPPSSAAAVGMETSAPRAGSQLAAMTARRSASYRAEAPRVSSRDGLADMAASSQGKGGRAQRRRRGEPPFSAPEGEGLRVRGSRRSLPGSPGGAWAERAPRARP